MKLTTHLHLVPRSKNEWSYTSEARNFEVMNWLHHVFEKWVERCKKCIACQERCFGKETVITPPKSSDSE
jgi:predicted alpha/beta hydrolase family esterase